MKRTFAVLALAFALAGCGSEAGPTVASAAGASGAPAPATTTNAVAEYVEAQRQWVACIRKQGFDLPDPDAEGKIDFSGQDNRRLKADPKWLAANEACAKFQREVPEELERLPALTAEQIANSRAYSACRRANGSPDFPDPGPDGYLPRNRDQEQQRELTEQELLVQRRSETICAPVHEGLPPNPNATFGPAQG
ncbi:hypothetical protein WEI85_41055 [Actinomycetes bacterium KLBMP 9797]